MHVITQSEIDIQNKKLSKQYLHNNLINEMKLWLKDRQFDVFATYRPKKTKIGAINSTRLFGQAIWNCGGIKEKPFICREYLV